MHLTRKQRQAMDLKHGYALDRMEGIARKNDWKTRQARKDFLRPAFQGTSPERKEKA